MSVRVYKKGDHPSGFIGVRVVRSFDNTYKQRYFNFRKSPAGEFVSRTKQKEIIEEAYALDRKWAEESSAIQYAKFVQSSHPSAKYGGIGVTGITVCFIREVTQKGSSFNPAFRVNIPVPNGGEKRFLIRKLGLDGAWCAAVELWSQLHEVRDVDKKRLMKVNPGRPAFLRLRRCLVADGQDIPLSSLQCLVG